MRRIVSTIGESVLRGSVAFSFSLVGLIFLSFAPLLADVEVTLKSGASLVGKVKVDGTDAVVTIDDSELRVPLSEVDTIAAAAAGSERQAQRLLLTALGAKKSGDGGTEVIGLLAEATRLAPDDPHIAFWYASTLADAGYGQAANDILAKQKEAISKAYPGMIDQLAARIKRRVAMESMPPALVERVDALNAELAKQSSAADQRQMAALFRIVDQEDMPIEQADFQIQCSGHDQNLESFDDGYFMYLYKQHRGNNDQPCHIEVMRPGLEAKSFDFSGSSSSVREAKKYVVKRYGEEARRPFRLALTDAAGKPVMGAQVSLVPVSSHGGGSNSGIQGETDAEGRAEIMAFPRKYSYRVSSQGFTPASGNVEIRADAPEPGEVKAQVYRAIRATIRLAWEATSLQGGGKTSGETTLDIGGGMPNQYGQNETSWIRPIQQKDRLTLQFVDYPYGHGGPFTPAQAWVRVVESENGAKPAEATGGEVEGGETEAVDEKPARLEEFTAIDLDEIDKLKEKLPQPRMLGGGQPTGPRPPMVLAAEPGKIFVGRLQVHDNRTGQPMQLAFKAFVDEVSTDD
jgi:hypothetical protein